MKGWEASTDPLSHFTFCLGRHTRAEVLSERQDAECSGRLDTMDSVELPWYRLKHPLAWTHLLLSQCLCGRTYQIDVVGLWPPIVLRTKSNASNHFYSSYFLWNSSLRCLAVCNKPYAFVPLVCPSSFPFPYPTPGHRSSTLRIQETLDMPSLPGLSCQSLWPDYCLFWLLTL